MALSTESKQARRLAAALEPCIGQVYFAPEAHAAYEQLGFAASPASFDGLAMPDGAAYFTSRGSLMGKVSPSVVAAAFAVFNPEAVVPAVAYGWSLTDDAHDSCPPPRGRRRATRAASSPTSTRRACAPRLTPSAARSSRSRPKAVRCSRAHATISAKPPPTTCGFASSRWATRCASTAVTATPRRG